MRLLITQDMPKAKLLSFFEKCHKSSQLPSSARAMSNNLKYQENRSSDVVKVEQAQTTIKACRRFFPHLEVTPKDMRSQFPLPKKKSASSSVQEPGRTATMAEKASRAAQSRAAIFAD